MADLLDLPIDQVDVLDSGAADAPVNGIAGEAKALQGPAGDRPGELPFLVLAADPFEDGLFAAVNRCHESEGSGAGQSATNTHGVIAGQRYVDVAPHRENRRARH